jgi:signal transduction histidine kinase
MQHEPDQELIEQSIAEILRQIRRISDIVQSLVNFSHAGSRLDRTASTFDLHGCVAEAIRLVQLSPTGKQLQYTNDVPATLEISGDRQQLVQVFINLLTNARDASKPGDVVDVHAQRRGDDVEIRVTDRGTGISEDVLDRIFEPFFTTKSPGEGTGLGLPLVYSIVQDHSGTISVESAPGRGTQFLLRLPLTADQLSRKAANPETSASQ